MTLENLNYRTNSMFLRNQFPALNAYGISEIPKAEFNDAELKELRQHRTKIVRQKRS